MLLTKKLSLFLFFATLSFTSAFALDGFLPIWLFAFVIAFFVNLAFFRPVIGRPIVAVELHDIVLVIFLLYLYIFSLINYSEKTWTYLAAYSFIFILLNYGCRAIFRNFHVRTIFIYNLLGVLLTCIFVVSDFAAFHYLFIDLQQYIPRFGPSTQALYWQGTFRRSYGFSTEPGILVFYLNTLGLIALWTAFKFLSKTMAIGFLAIFGTAWFTTFSAGCTASLIAAIAVAVATRVVASGPVFVVKRGALFIILIVVLVVGYLSLSGGIEVATPILEKLTFQDANVGSMRLERWQFALSEIASQPLGVGGLGSASEQGIAVLSWYLLLGMEVGVFPVFMIMFYISLNFWRAARLSGSVGFILTASIAAGAIQLFAISSFFHPFLWVSMAMASAFAAEKTTLSRNVLPNNVERVAKTSYSHVVGRKIF